MSFRLGQVLSGRAQAVDVTSLADIHNDSEWQMSNPDVDVSILVQYPSTVS